MAFTNSSSLLYRNAAKGAKVISERKEKKKKEIFQRKLNWGVLRVGS